MKKIFNTIVLYAVLGLSAGVFFREFTKFNDFTGVTVLGNVHGHLLALGVLFFLIILALEKSFELTKHPYFKRFFYIYNIGLIFSATMMLTRGIVQVKAIELSKAMTAALSGFAGLGHLVVGIAFVFFFIILKKQIETLENK